METGRIILNKSISIDKIKNDIIFNLENLKIENYLLQESHSSIQIIFEKYYRRAQGHILGIVLINQNNNQINIDIITGGGLPIDASAKLELNKEINDFIDYLSKNKW